jgi:hypothetical protein
LVEKGVLTEGTKQPSYEHRQNYNFEQYLNYTKVLREMTKPKPPMRAVKRRARRKYDRPRFNLDLSEYFVWPHVQS